MVVNKAEILTAFGCTPDAALYPLGKGNINATYLVEQHDTSFVLQKISAEVFPDPQGIAENFKKVSDHIRANTTGSTADLVVASPVLTQDGKIHFNDSGGGVWRGQEFVKTVSTSRITSRNQAVSVGRILARFHHRLADLNIEEIVEPLPGFHNLSGYLQVYDSSNGPDSPEKKEIVEFCRDFIEDQRSRAMRLEEAVREGRVTPQPVHGDPKVDNFIFDRTLSAVGLLDLDTVGSGIIYHDLGDCLRSACNTVKESGEKGRAPRFNLELCKEILSGYFSSDGGRVGDDDLTLIYDGLVAICFELGLRFFTDHLHGNTYFRVRKQHENLLRAETQFLLCADVTRREAEIRDALFALYKKR